MSLKRDRYTFFLYLSNLIFSDMGETKSKKYQEILSTYNQVVESVDKDLVQHLSKNWFFEKLDEELKKNNIKVSRRTVYRAFKSSRLNKNKVVLWSVPRL